MDSDERDRIAEQFGVGHRQVERDHLVSHLWHFSAKGSATASNSSAEPPLPGHISLTEG
jgi:hypothetical protein